MIHPEIILQIEKKKTKIDQETILSHHIETIHKVQIDKTKAIEVVRRSIIDKLFNYNLLMKQLRTPQILTIQNFRNSTKPYTL